MGVHLGVADHAGWAVVVAAGADGALVDRRRVELLESGLPKLPHHHECQSLPLEEALALVDEVRASAARCAAVALDALAAELDAPITGIALRELPEMPNTVAETLADYRAQCTADSVMYRSVLAEAAEARGWAVAWYPRKTVVADLGAALGVDAEAWLKALGKSLGPPWQKDHRTALAAAVVAARE